MCIWELWVYLKCTATPASSWSTPASPAPHDHAHHQFLYPVTPCTKRHRCEHPTSTDSSTEVRIIRMNQYCPTCFEALRNTIGGNGEMCWSASPADDWEWEWDERLTVGMELVDFVPADGSDAVGAWDAGGRTDSRFRAAGRSWSGWEGFR